MAARKSRRLGIIAAFILLDKSGDGALDKNELLDFLNETAGLDFDVQMDDDLELNGIEFVEVAEHLVERMKRLPEPTLDDSLHIPPPGRESRGSGGGSMTGSPRSGSPLRGFGMKTLAPVEGMYIYYNGLLYIIMIYMICWG